MKKIKELFKGIEYKLIGMSAGFMLRGLSSDSRTVKRGDLFIAVKGHREDGHNYIDAAIKKGAGAVCAQRAVKGHKKTGFIIVNDTSKILPFLASRFYGEPAKSLKFIGITGTNGKTTTSHLVHEIFKMAGKSPSLLGTVSHKIGSRVIKSNITTPGPMELHALLSRMKKCGTDYVVMEVSSHALRQSRTRGVNFRIAALTNITGDHLEEDSGLRYS